MENRKNPNEENEEVRGLLRGIGHPSVPDGFTANVLEESRRRQRRFSFLDIRIVVPATAALVLLFVFLGFQGSNPEQKMVVMNSTSVEPSAQSYEETPAESQEEAVTPFRKLDDSENPFNVNPVPPPDETEISREAVKPPTQVRLGSGAGRAVPNPAMTSGSINPETILSILGIDAEPSSNGWVVKSVSSQSVADKAGVKNGDLIEAVNDVPLGGNGVILRSLSIDRLVVRRAGQRITLQLTRM
jgi:hypothetical protein